MLTFPEPASARAEHEDAINRLKGMENPFESLVRPQRGDPRFRDLDVPALLSEPRNLLLEVIDSYRVEEYTSALDLRPTRVVIVRGDRGAGKTHLLRSLQYRSDGRSQVLVRPTFCKANLPFEEYLHSQLMGVLLEEDELFSGKPFEDISRALTRRLLRQAVLGLGPTERLFSCSPGRWRRFALLWGRGDRLASQFDDLAQALAEPDAARQLPSLIRSHGLSPAQCLRILEGHLGRHEKGKSLLVAIRQRLYRAMARFALLDEEEALRRFLEGEYLPPDTGQRFEIVLRVLQVLTEACALERFPIVFAFDNLERLLSPLNRFDGELARSFLQGLAQAVDSTRGLLLVLFAEHGLFDSQIAPHMDPFVVGRLSQGVPLHARGPVVEVLLKRPSAPEVTQLVKARIKDRLASSLPEGSVLPDPFPFTAGFVKDASEGSGNLREIVQRLRDEYVRVVYQREPTSDDSAGTVSRKVPDWSEQLSVVWKAAQVTASRKLEESKVGHAQSLHAGLGMLLQQVLPLRRGDWELKDIQAGVTVGEHPTYGLVTLLDWQVTNASEPANGKGKTWRVGVGLLLAGGGGMAHDLRAKFDLFREKARKANGLIILWPRPVDAEDLIALLPSATRKAWDESPFRTRTRLQWLSLADLCAMQAFSDWKDRVAEETGGRVPPEAIREFLGTRCESIFQLLQPLTPGRVERTAADED